MDTKKKKVLKVLEKYQGIVTNVCGSIHLARSTYYQWLKTDPDFKSAVDEIQEVAIDFVEGKLMEKIRGIQCTAVDSKGNTTVYSQPPSDTAIIFYLKTKGKKRGYVERSEITGKDGKDLQAAPLLFLSADKLTEDQIQEYIQKNIESN